MKHNNTFKRIISTVLCICLLAGTFVVSSSAATVPYNGSSAYMSSKFGKNLLNCEITGDQKNDVLNLAKSQLGYKEGWLAGSGNTDDKIENLTEYNRWYYGSNDPAPWCAIWVSFILRHAGVSTDVIPNFSGCSKAVSKLSKGEWGKDHGTWHDAYLNGKNSYTPKAGDIVFFSWESDFVPYRYYIENSEGESIGQVNHLGFVLEDAASPTSYIKCIEGNSSDKVAVVSQNPRNVVGYFTPDYADNEEENNLGTIDVIEPKNINNAWISPEQPGYIKWSKFSGATYYEYTIREQKYKNGEYIVIDNWICNNVKTNSTYLDLSQYNLKPACAYKVWVAAFNANGEIIAENFVYLRMLDSGKSNTDDGRTEFDESFTGGNFGGMTDILTKEEETSAPNTSDEGYRTDFDETYFDDLTGDYNDPEPEGGYQIESGNGETSSKPSPSDGIAEPSNPENNTGFEDWDIIDERDPDPDIGFEDNSYDETNSNEENNSASDETQTSTNEAETITLLKRIIAMLEVIFKFFGITI